MDARIEEGPRGGKALTLGKTRVCRDLSAVQAIFLKSEAIFRHSHLIPATLRPYLYPYVRCVTDKNV
jgi:hypothetical protein